MKFRPAKTIWIGLICLGVLVYLLLLGQINIQQFKSKLTLRTQKNLLQLAQAKQHHFNDLFELLSRQLCAATAQLKDSWSLRGGSDSGMSTLVDCWGALILSIDRTDPQGAVIQHYGQDTAADVFTYAPLLAACQQDNTGQNDISVVMDMTSDTPCVVMFCPVSEGEIFKGAMILRIPVIRLLKRLQEETFTRDIRTCLINGEGKMLTVMQEKTVLLSNAAGELLPHHLLDNVQKGRSGIGIISGYGQGSSAANDLLIGHWPVNAILPGWSIAAIHEDESIRTAVVEHARNIQIGMICLFTAVFLIWLMYCRHFRRHILSEQHTSLGRVTEELHYLSMKSRQTQQELERQIKLYRGLLNAVPMGLYWKDSEGRLMGYNPEYAHIKGLKKMEEGLTSVRTDLFESQQNGLPLDMEVMNKDIELLFIPQTLIHNGFSRTYLVSKIAVKDEKGQVCGLLSGLLNQEFLKTTQNGSFCPHMKDLCVAEIVPCPLVLVDRQGRIIQANSRFLNRFEISQPQPHRHKLTELLSLESSDTIDRLICGYSESCRKEPSSIHINWHSIGYSLTSQPFYEGTMLKGVLLLFVETAAPKQTSSTQEITSMQESNQNIQNENKEQAVRILIVDDVEENRELLKIILSKLDYHPILCSSGRQAVTLCRKEKYDLVLMDIQMPEMNGLEATRQIRTDSLNLSVPIIAMTASNQKDDELAALECGCDDYLSKPISRKLLEQKIWRSLAKVQQIRQAEEGYEITSFLQGDPDYHKTIETFVGNLPGRIEEIRQAFEKNDLKELAFKVHALKGLGGFAGFAVYTEKAALIENSLRDQNLDKIQQQIDEMVDMCMRTKIKSDTK